MKHRLQALFARWIRRRQGADSLPVAIHRRRLYILPTRAGATFAALLLVMLIAGLNYANSSAMFLTFLLSGFALVSMHQCYRNLLQVTLQGVTPLACFAGETASLGLTLGNDSRISRYQIEADAMGDPPVAIDLLPHSIARLELALATPRRGVIRIDRIRLATTFPFGLFHAWTWIHMPVEVIVYPRARGKLPMPSQSGLRAGQRARPDSGTEEWMSLRPFRDGDSPRQVAWKAYARGAPLLVKEYGATGSDLRLFEFARLAQLDTEARLEQLARWLVDAEAQGERYGLSIPSRQIAPNRGPEHRHRCLSALAMHGLERPR